MIDGLLIKASDENYQKIILDDYKIIDLRSEGEFQKSSLPNSINIPILDDKNRHLVGKKYKEAGKSEAIKLGLDLVDENMQREFTRKIKSHIQNKNKTVLTCHRGGNRSMFAQKWLEKYECIALYRLEKGYKDFRFYLISSLESENIKTKSLILSGNTGSAKTELIKKLSMAIDLEKLANHRGSAFGSKLTDQPSQASFENALAYSMIKIQEENHKFIVFESESRNIGKVQIPKSFFEYMHSAPYVSLKSTIEDRIENTYNEYIIKDLNESLAYQKSEAEFFENLREKIIKLEKRLGKERLVKILEIFDKAIIDSNLALHKKWIGFLLQNYYDPMYEHHRQRYCDKIMLELNFDKMYTELERLNR